MPLNLKTAAHSVLISLSLATAASAGALGDPIIEKPLELIEEPDWQGFRLGLTYNGEMSGNTTAASEGFPFLDAGHDNDGNLGGFVGFDLQRGQMVYGLEYQHIQRDSAVQGDPSRVHGDISSLRVRIGRTAGKTLFYGSIGAAQSTFDDAGTNIDMDGYVAGIGIERLFGKNGILGLAVDHYDLSGERLATTVESKHTVLQLRVGFKF